MADKKIRTAGHLDQLFLFSALAAVMRLSDGML